MINPFLQNYFSYYYFGEVQSSPAIISSWWKTSKLMASSSPLLKLPLHEDRHDQIIPAISLTSSSSSLNNARSITLFKLVSISSIFIALAITIVFLLFPNFVVSANDRRNPAVIIFSFDGFRFGYQLKAPTPSIRRLINGGTSADEGLIPVFPTLTFPNHYSIATGLFPPYHGIINNYFPDPENPTDWFSVRNHDPKWWLGEPLWQTVARHGFNAATYFWAGSEVSKGNWTCPPKFCFKYNQSVPFEERVDAVLGFFDLPQEEIPILSMVYFQDPDSQGHIYGPDHPEITKAVVELDAVVGRLILGLEKRGIFNDVTIILLGDHGMAGTCDEKYVFLEELGPWVQIESDWIKSADSLLTIQPASGVSPREVVEKMNSGLSSGKVGNGGRLSVYLKEDLPERFHYADSRRIPAIVGVVEEGYTVKYKREMRYDCGGSHGYDNSLISMRTFFVGHGPRFARGKKIPSFLNIEIYNVVTSILGLKGAPNNGSISFLNSLLLKLDL